MRKWLKLDQSIMLNETRWIFTNLLALCQHLIRLYKTFQFIFSRGSFTKSIFAYFGDIYHTQDNNKNCFQISKEIMKGKCEAECLTTKFKIKNFEEEKTQFLLFINFCWHLTKTSTSPSQNFSQLFRQISQQILNYKHIGIFWNLDLIYSKKFNPDPKVS